MNTNQLYLKPEEGMFLSMSVVAMLEDLNKSAKNPRIPFNPETRKQLKDMVSAGTSLKVKLQKLGFDMRELPPYLDGDETEFLTKES